MLIVKGLLLGVVLSAVYSELKLAEAQEHESPPNKRRGGLS